MANKTVGDLLDDFASRQLGIEQENERRMREDAEVAAWTEKKRALLGEKLKRAFLGRPFDREEELAEAEQRELALARKKGLLREPACPLCGGRGVVSGRYCKCFRQAVYREIFGAEDITALKAHFCEADLDIFDDSAALKMGKTQRSLAEQAYGISRRYVESFPDTARRDLLIRGSAGLGKTHLLNCIAAAAYGRGIDVCLIGAGALFGVFYRDRLGGEMPLAFLKEAELLLIDDLGTEPMTQNVTQEYLFDLLDRRGRAGLHTCTATNVIDLAARYGERISSRLESREGAVLWLDGADLRRMRK